MRGSQIEQHGSNRVTMNDEHMYWDKNGVWTLHVLQHGSYKGGQTFDVMK